jgi:hypothetical protein
MENRLGMKWTGQRSGGVSSPNSYRLSRNLPVAIGWWPTNVPEKAFAFEDPPVATVSCHTGDPSWSAHSCVYMDHVDPVACNAITLVPEHYPLLSLVAPYDSFSQIFFSRRVPLLCLGPTTKSRLATSNHAARGWSRYGASTT